jgi:hypothetical protein
VAFVCKGCSESAPTKDVKHTDMCKSKTKIMKVCTKSGQKPHGG